MSYSIDIVEVFWVYEMIAALFIGNKICSFSCRLNCYTANMEVEIIDGIRVLNQLMAKLLIKCRSFDVYKYTPELTNDWNDMTRTAFNSTNMNTVILALCKWLEFYKGYSRVIPDSVKDEDKELCKKFHKLKITEFRNKFLGAYQK